jgi:hypothetical protein
MNGVFTQSDDVRDLRKVSPFGRKQGFLAESILSEAEGLEMTRRRKEAIVYVTQPLTAGRIEGAVYN